MAILGGWRLTRAGVLFIVGILVLGSLLTGGILYVKGHGETVRRDEAVKIAEQNLKDQSEVATQPVNSTDSDDDSSTATTGTHTDADTTVVATNNQATVLPETGFDGTARIVIVAILALSIAFYVASRRAVSRL